MAVGVAKNAVGISVQTLLLEVVVELVIVELLLAVGKGAVDEDLVDDLVDKDL